ncbi:hypothetical protein AB0C77_15975 [Streptomyces sp. NPDC048629]|uniref:hypothetical protein n=1 Tax=Streptomyces sp. NPDC048629 TaxID=3154824 RepID=UPI00343C47DB
MIAESLFWEEMATHVRGMKPEFAGSAFGAARTMEGDGARALEASLRKFTEEVPAGQELPAFEQIGKYLLEVSENLRKIAIQVETTKVTILGMASWLVAQLAIAAATLIWSLGTTTLFAAGVWAAIRAAVPLVLRQLLISILTGALMMGGINAVAQVVGFAKGTRRDFGAENFKELGINVAMGAIGGAIGFGVGKAFTAGVTKVFGAKAAQSFAASVVGGVVNNAVTSVAMIPIAEQITGAKGGHLTWETFTSGAAFGAAGHAMNAAKQTTVLKVNPAKVPKVFNNSVLKLKTNFDGGPGGGGVPRGGGAPNTGGGLGEKPKFGDNASTTSTHSSSGSDGPGGDMGISVTKETVVTSEPRGLAEQAPTGTTDMAWPVVPTHEPEQVTASTTTSGVRPRSISDVLSGQAPDPRVHASPQSQSQSQPQPQSQSQASPAPRSGAASGGGSSTPPRIQDLRVAAEATGAGAGAVPARASVPGESGHRRTDSGFGGDVVREKAAGVAAGSDGLSDLQGRLDRLRDGEKSSGFVVGEDLSGGQGGLAPERVEELLAGAPAVPGSGDVVGAREAAVLESLVVRARTAGMSVQEIAGWQERFVQAWRDGPQAESGFGELARQWHQELDGLSGGSSRPGVEELLRSAPATVETPLEVLVRAAEDAGVPLVEHASWMERIREAWGQGRGEDAATLVEQFWGRIEEAKASGSAELELGLLAQLAELRGLPVEEFLAAKVRQDAADSILREDLKAVLGIPEGGLENRLRTVLERVSGDAVGSPLVEGLKDILESRPDGVPEQLLRDDVTALLEQRVGARQRPEAHAGVLKELDALAGVPVGDAVWADGVARELAGEGRRVGMAEEEIGLWEERLREASDKQAVAADWRFRQKQFEIVETLVKEATDAGQGSAEAEAFAVRLRDALAQEDLPEFNRLEGVWREEISAARQETEFQDAVDDVFGGLKEKADRFGMAPDEWAGFESRLRQARGRGDLAEVLRIIDERTLRLEELESGYEAGVRERLDVLRGGAGTGSGEAEAFGRAVEPEWRDGGDEAGLWEVFEEKKPDTLKPRFDDPEDNPLRDLDDTDDDGPGGWDADARRRLKDLQEDLFSDARRARMTPEELEIWKRRIDAADDPVAVKEELRRRIEQELVPQAEFDARLAEFEKARRRELIDLGFTPHELNAHRLGMEAAARRGDSAMGARLAEAFEAKVDAKRSSQAPDVTEPVRPQGLGEALLERQKPPTGKSSPDDSTALERPTTPSPLDEALYRAAKEQGVPPSRLKTEPDEPADTAKHLTTELDGSLTLDPPLAPARLKALRELSAVVDIDALREFEAGPYGELSRAHQLKARLIVADTMHFPLTIAKNGERLPDRSPLEYWTVVAVAQALAAGPASAEALAERIREDRDLPRSTGLRGGTRNFDQDSPAPGGRTSQGGPYDGAVRGPRSLPFTPTLGTLEETEAEELPPADPTLKALRAAAVPLAPHEQLNPDEDLFYGGRPLGDDLEVLDTVHESLLDDSPRYLRDYELVRNLLRTDISSQAADRELAAFARARGFHPDVIRYWSQGIHQEMWLESYASEVGASADADLDTVGGQPIHPLPTLIFDSSLPSYEVAVQDRTPAYEPWEERGLLPIAGLVDVAGLRAFEDDVRRAVVTDDLRPLFRRAVGTARLRIGMADVSGWRPGDDDRLSRPQEYWTVFAVARFLSDNATSETLNEDALRLAEDLRQAFGLDSAAQERARSRSAPPPGDQPSLPSELTHLPGLDIPRLLRFERELTDVPDDDTLDVLVRNAIDTVRSVMSTPQIFGARPGPGFQAQAPSQYWAILAVAEYLRSHAHTPTRDLGARKLAEEIRVAAGLARGDGIRGGMPSGGSRGDRSSAPTNEEPESDSDSSSLNDEDNALADALTDALLAEAGGNGTTAVSLGDTHSESSDSDDLAPLNDEDTAYADAFTAALLAEAGGNRATAESLGDVHADAESSDSDLLSLDDEDTAFADELTAALLAEAGGNRTTADSLGDVHADAESSDSDSSSLDDEDAAFASAFTAAMTAGDAESDHSSRGEPEPLEQRLVDEGMTLWNEDDTLTDEATETIRPLILARARREAAEWGGARPLDAILASEFLPQSHAAARPIVEGWLREDGFVVLSDEDMPPATALVLARATSRKPSAIDIARHVWPDARHESNAVPRTKVAGYLEAAGFAMGAGITVSQMVVSIAALRVAEQGGFMTPLIHIAEDILGKRNPRATTYPARIGAWDQASRYLDKVGGGGSVYARYVAAAVTAARESYERTQVTDIAQVAARTFGVATPSEGERAAVGFWLEQAGLQGLTDSMAGTSTAPPRVFPSRPRSSIGTLSMLVGLFRLDDPQPGAYLALRARAEYAVWKFAELRGAHTHVSLRDLAALTFAKGTASSLEIAMTGGFLEAVGLGHEVQRQSTITDHMGDAIRKARLDLLDGKPVVPSDIANSLDLPGAESYVNATLEAWFTTTGLMGGPLDPNGVLGTLKSVFTDEAAAQPTLDAKEVFQTVFGQDDVTGNQLTMAEEWLAEPPEKQYALGLAGRARREGEELDVSEIVRRAFNENPATPASIGKVVDWLEESELLPSSEELTSTSASGDDSDRADSVDFSPYFGDIEPDQPPAGAADAVLADYAVSLAMYMLHQFGNSTVDVKVIIRKALRKPATYNPSVPEQYFFSGVLELMGALGAEEMRGNFTRQQMHEVIGKTDTDLGAVPPRKIRPVTYARELYGAGAARNRSPRIKGWTTAYVGMAGPPQDGAVRKMIDRTVELATAARAAGQQLDVYGTARRVFLREQVTPHQMFLINLWLERAGLLNDPAERPASESSSSDSSDSSDSSGTSSGTSSDSSDSSDSLDPMDYVDSEQSDHSEHSDTSDPMSTNSHPSPPASSHGDSMDTSSDARSWDRDSRNGTELTDYGSDPADSDAEPLPAPAQQAADRVRTAVTQDWARLAERGARAEQRLQRAVKDEELTPGTLRGLYGRISALAGSHVSTRARWEKLSERQRTALAWLVAEARWFDGTTAANRLVARLLREDALFGALPDERLRSVLSEAAGILETEHPSWLEGGTDGQRVQLLRVAHALHTEGTAAAERAARRHRPGRPPRTSPLAPEGRATLDAVPPFRGGVSFRSHRDGAWAGPAAASEALLAVLQGLPRPETLVVEGPRHGGLMRAQVRGQDGRWREEHWPMLRLSQELLDDPGLPDEYPLVLAMPFAAQGPLLGGVDEYGRPRRDDPPGQLLADARRTPVVAPWGKVHPGRERQGGPTVILVERPFVERDNPAWTPWVVFTPRDTDVLRDLGVPQHIPQTPRFADTLALFRANVRDNPTPPTPFPPAPPQHEERPPTRRRILVTGRVEEPALRRRADEAGLAESMLRDGPAGKGRPLDAIARRLWPGDRHAGSHRVHARLIEHSEEYRRDYRTARTLVFGDDGDTRPLPDTQERLLAYVRARGLDESLAAFWEHRLEAGRAARTNRGKQRQGHVDDLWFRASGLVNQWAPLPGKEKDWSPLKQAEMLALVEEHNHHIVRLLRSGVTPEAAEDAAVRLGLSLGVRPRPYAQGGMRPDETTEGETSTAPPRPSYHSHRSTLSVATTGQRSVFTLLTDASHPYEEDQRALLERAQRVVARLEREAADRADSVGDSATATASRHTEPDPWLRPLTDAEAEAWVEDQAAQAVREVQQTAAEAGLGGDTLHVPHDAPAETLERVREEARVRAWQRLTQLEREALSVGPQSGATTASDGGGSVRSLDDLEIEQRPHVDVTASEPLPRSDDEFVTFDDESRVPAHLRNLGHSTITIRGVNSVAAEIRRRLGLPDEALERLRFALVDQPQRFFGDGFALTYEDTDGRPHEIVVALRNYGRWTRYRDTGRTPIRLDKELQRRTVAGENRSASHAPALTVTVPIGPGSSLVSPFGSVRFNYRVNEPTYGFSTGDVSQTTVQLRGKEDTHAHVDDLWVELRDVTEIRRPRRTPLGFLTGRSPLDVAFGRTGGASRATTPAGVTGFAVRSGLLWTASDSVTKPSEPDLLPPEFPLTRASVPEVFFTEDVGSLDDIFRWAKTQLPEAWLDTPAHAELRRFFSAENFRSVLDQAFRSPVSSEPLYKADTERTVLGAFEMFVEPDTQEDAKATLLRPYSAVTELRSQNTVKLTSERSRSLTKGLGLGLTGGPAFGPGSARVQLALTGQYNYARTESALHGSTASSNAALTILDHGGTYSMALNVRVRRTGAEWRTFPLTAQLRIPRNEARRLAGWDDNAQLPPGVPEPFAPPFLTEDRPPTLGGSTKVKSLTWQDGEDPGRMVVEELFDRVHRSLAARYPGLLLPPRPHTRDEWGWKRLADPRTWSRIRQEGWAGSDQDYRNALANTLKLRRMISEARTEAALERMMTTGLPIRLERMGAVHEEYVTVTLRAELTGRRFGGFRHDVGLRTGGAVQQSGKRSTVLGQGVAGGVHFTATVKDPTGVKAGSAGVQATGSRQARYQSSAGPSAAAEGSSGFRSRSHVWEYDISFSATVRSYRRPRVRVRIATGSLMGARWFILRDTRAQLLGDGGAADRVNAVVSLYAPAALSPETDPHLAGAPNPFLGRLPREVPVESVVLDQALARRLVSGRPLPEFTPLPWQQRPHTVASVPFPRHLLRTAKTVLGEVSDNAWFYELQGTPAHDSLVEGLSPGQGEANFTLATSPFGWQLAGLHGMGAATDRDAAVVIRARVRKLKPLVLVPGGHIMEVSYDAQLTGGSQTGVTGTTTVAVSAGGGHTFAVGQGGKLSVVVNTGLNAELYSRTTGSSTAVQLTAGANRSLERAGRSVLLVGDVDWLIAATSREKGVLAHSANISTKVAARRVTTEAGVLIWMGEQDALELGLLDDHLGEVPRWTEPHWSEPDWADDAPLYHVNDGVFDLSGLLQDFQEQTDLMTSARSLVLPKNLLDDRTGQLTRLSVVLSPDGLRGLAHEMVRGGYSIRTFQPRVRSSREGTIEFRLERGTPVLAGLRTGTFLVTSRSATLAVTQGSSSGYAWSVGPGLNISAVAAGTTGTAGATEKVGTAYNQTSAASRSAARNADVEAEGPEGVFDTPYRMTVRVLVGGRERFRVRRDIGTLREHHPLSLLKPQSGPGGGLRETEPPVVRPFLKEPTVALRDAILGWKLSQEPGYRLFAGGSRTVSVQKVGNIPELVSGVLLALDAATGAKQPDGTRSALVKDGTPVHDVVRNVVSATVLEAFFHDAMEHGLTATLHGNAVVGGLDAVLDLHPRVHLDGAELLAVDHGQDLGEKFRVTHSTALSDSASDSQQPSVTGGPAFATTDPLFNRVGTSALMPTSTATGASSHDPLTLHVATNKLRLPAGRSFLFRFPVSWLQVAHVERRIKDGKTVQTLTSAVGLQPPAPLPPGVVEVQTPHGVYAWVREDVALQFGLLTEENYPDEVKTAWDHAKTFTDDWKKAFNDYWSTRSAVSTAWHEWDTALTESTAATRARATAEAAARQAREKAKEAAAALETTRRQADDAQDEAVRRRDEREHAERVAHQAAGAAHEADLAQQQAGQATDRAQQALEAALRERDAAAEDLAEARLLVAATEPRSDLEAATLAALWSETDRHRTAQAAVVRAQSALERARQELADATRQRAERRTALHGARTALDRTSAALRVAEAALGAADEALDDATGRFDQARTVLEDAQTALDAARTQEGAQDARFDGRNRRLLALHQELSDRHRATRVAGHRLHRARTAADAVTTWYQLPPHERTAEPPQPWNPDDEVELTPEPRLPLSEVEAEVYTRHGEADRHAALARAVLDEWLDGLPGGIEALRTGAGLLPTPDTTPWLDQAQRDSVLHEWRRVYAYAKDWVNADTDYRAALRDEEATADRLDRARGRALDALRRVEAVRDRTAEFTDWHTTPPGRRTGPAPQPWLPPAGTGEQAAAEDDEATRYVRETDEGSGRPLRLTAPDGTTYRVVDAAPADEPGGSNGTTGPRHPAGSSFHLSLAHQLDSTLPWWRRTYGVPDGDGPNTVAALRELLARRLETAATTDPDDPDAPLIDDVTALDLKEQPTADELDRVGIVLSEKHRLEFDALGTLPTGAAHALGTRPELRRALLAALLRRRADTPDRTGWHHTAADLLAPLAAQVFGVRITVVRDDLGHQTFGHPDAPEIVLHLADAHWYAAEETSRG